MKKFLLIISLFGSGFVTRGLVESEPVQAKPVAVRANLCANRSTGAVRYTTGSCRRTERLVTLNAPVAPVNTKKISIKYLGAPSPSGGEPFCSTGSSFDASGVNQSTSGFGRWIFGAGITPPSNMFNLTLDSRVLANGMNWKQIPECLLEVTVIVP